MRGVGYLVKREHVSLQLEQGVAASRAAFMVIIETGNRATSAHT